MSTPKTAAEQELEAIANLLIKAIENIGKNIADGKVADKHYREQSVIVLEEFAKEMRNNVRNVWQS